MAYKAYKQDFLKPRRRSRSAKRWTDTISMGLAYLFYDVKGMPATTMNERLLGEQGGHLTRVFKSSKSRYSAIYMSTANESATNIMPCNFRSLIIT